jgi:hypothetical protein
MALASAWAGALTLPAPASADAGADRVFVGAYVKDVQDIDVAAETFTVDVFLWLRWTNPNINPPATLEVMNSSGFKTPQPRPLEAWRRKCSMTRRLTYLMAPNTCS